MGFFDFVTKIIPDPVVIFNAVTNPADQNAQNALLDEFANHVQAIDDLTEEVTGVKLSQVLDEMGDAIDDAFSKDGIFTQFVEDYVPGGGFVTAIVHAAAGNEEHAQAAALKGVTTTISTAGAIAGGMVGGPMGAAAGGMLGAAAANLFEDAAHDLVSPELQHRFQETSLESLLIDSSIGALTGGRGNVKAASRVAKAALSEGVEDISAKALRNAIARDLTTRAFTQTVVIDAAAEGARALAGEVDIPRFTQLEALELMTRQAFEDRIMGTAAATGELLGQTAQDFAHMVHPELGDYWVRNGTVVWSEDEADALEVLAAVNAKGFDSVTEYREVLISSWATSYDNDVEAGRETDDWVARDNDILGDFMVKNGHVVWGAHTEEEAEAGLIRQELDRRGYDSIEDFRADMINSYRMAHEANADNFPDGEWTLRENDILGDFMINGGHVVWGTHTEAEADALLTRQLHGEAGEYGTPENTFDPDTPPATGGPLIVEGDFDAPPETGGPLIVEEADPPATEDAPPAIVDDEDIQTVPMPPVVAAEPAVDDASGVDAAPDFDAPSHSPTAAAPDDFDRPVGSPTAPIRSTVEPGPMTPEPRLPDEVPVEADPVGTAPTFHDPLAADWDRPAEQPEPSFDPSARGSSGEDVRELQEALAAQGIDTGPLDGVFGPRTEAAVRQFQAAHGLQVDGIVGTDTIHELETLDDPFDPVEPIPELDLHVELPNPFEDPDGEVTPGYGFGVDLDGDGIPDAWTTPDDDSPADGASDQPDLLGIQAEPFHEETDHEPL